MKLIKRMLAVGTAFYIMGTQVLSVQAAVWPSAPAQYAGGAVVMDADTGAVLYEKNMHGQFYPASTTKLMTTLLALENGDLDETITFSHNSVFDIEPGSSILGGLDEGDTLTLEQCLYGIMLCSGNEISYAVAERFGGDLSGFAELMNQRAAELGCENTHFTNPHGLHDDNHYTSAYDLALIAKKALEFDTFRTVASTAYYDFPPTKDGEQRRRSNHHRMLAGIDNKYTYDGCLGGKTGYTVTAKNTLVTFAERNGITLICVVLLEESKQQWADTKTLLDYGFDNFARVNVYDDFEKEERFGELKSRINEAAGSEVVQDGDKETLLSAIGKDAVLTVPDGTALSELSYAVDCRPADGGYDLSVSFAIEEHDLGQISFFLAEKEQPAEAAEPVSEDSEEEPEQKKPVPVVGIVIGAGFLVLFAALAVVFLPGIKKDYERTKRRKEIIERRRQARMNAGDLEQDEDMELLSGEAWADLPGPEEASEETEEDAADDDDE